MAEIKHGSLLKKTRGNSKIMRSGEKKTYNRKIGREIISCRFLLSFIHIQIFSVASHILVCRSDDLACIYKLLYSVGTPA